MSSVEDSGLSLLRIKSGVVRRLVKEQEHYLGEAEAIKSKINELKENGVEALKQEEELLEESLKMVPDCQERLNKAFEELQDVVKKEEENLKESDEFKLGVKLLEEVKMKFK